MIAFVPGFATVFWEYNLFHFDMGATNIPLPVPWPWSEPTDEVSEPGRQLFVGGFFVATLAFAALAPLWILLRRQARPSPVLVAAVALAIPYAHYAFSRADVEHLALGIFPLVLGGFAALSNLRPRLKWPAAVLLCAASLLTMLPVHPAWRCRPSQRCVEKEVAGSRLLVDIGTAGHLALLERLQAELCPDRDAFIAVPFWPGAYAALRHRAPLYDNYLLWPATEVSQQADIERIRAADPCFAVIYDAGLDHRDDLDFDGTNPRVDAFIRDQFEPVSGYADNPPYRIYRRRAATP
jgi:hypothetical protein